MILGFAHPCLVVRDLERARSFYQEMFGFKVISEEGWENEPEIDAATGLTSSRCKGYMMAGHNCFLELFEFQEPKPAEESETVLANKEGLRHLAFFVDDCQKEYERLLALGGHRLGTLTSSEEPGRAVYCRDPFGNIIELCEIPSALEHPTQLPGVSSTSAYEGSRGKEV